MVTTRKKLLAIYKGLLSHFGPQGWWPAKTRFEICVGAILTQATAWQNVEKAIDNLEREKLLTPDTLKNVKQRQLAKLIRPSLYYNTKAKKLKSFVGFLCENYDCDLHLLLKLPKDKLREELLGVWGIGPETADSIVLYAADKPSFVVDAYTMRIFGRMRMLDAGAEYSTAKAFFEKNLPNSTKLFKEFHALIIELGKNYCRKKPNCGECPVTALCRKST